MKKIEAYIRPHKWNDVLFALHGSAGFLGVSATDVRGVARGSDSPSHLTVADEVLDTLHYVRADLVCDDADVGALTQAIVKAAHTGLPGDGHVFVLDVDSAVRIREGGKQ